jgi:hypothetical protein
MGIRQKIEDALQATPNISLDELRKQLPDIKPGSLKAEFYKLRRKQVETVRSKKKSVQQQVSEYLNKNAETTFDTLKSAFPDIKNSSLSAYKSVWKKEQPEKQDKQEKPTVKHPSKSATKKKKLDKIAKPGKPKQTVKSAKKKDKPVRETKLDKPAKKDDTDLIQSLKKTIAAQEKTINTLHKTLELLNPESDGDLKGITLSEIKSIAVTYLKSIKELPAKLRR